MATAVLANNTAYIASTAPQLPIPIPNDTLGAMFIGSMISAILYGVTLYQISRYYELYPVDALMCRMLVPALFVLETVHTLCTAESCYFYMISNHSSRSSILRSHSTFTLVIPTTAVTTLLCHSFYARRVYLPLVSTVPTVGSHHSRIVAVAAILNAAGMAFCLVATAKVFISPWVATVERYSWAISAYFGCTLCADTLLTGTLIYILLHSRTGFKGSDSTVETLVLYTANTGMSLPYHGLLTSAVGVVVFILALMERHNLIWAGAGVVGNKLYANAVLAALNSRRSLASRTFEQSPGAEVIELGTRTRAQQVLPALGSDINAPGAPVAFPDARERMAGRGTATDSEPARRAHALYSAYRWDICDPEKSSVSEG